jgi:hypothetical protein
MRRHRWPKNLFGPPSGRTIERIAEAGRSDQKRSAPSRFRSGKDFRDQRLENSVLENTVLTG